jgi:hypothetical protein
MGRSTKKGPYVEPKLFAKFSKARESGDGQPITTWASRCTIVPEFVGTTFMVHNGKAHIKVLRYGRYGRSQAWRVCTDSDFPWARWQGRQEVALFLQGFIMAFRAVHRHARISARKVRPLADLVRGKFADEALEHC